MSSGEQTVLPRDPLFDLKFEIGECWFEIQRNERDAAVLKQRLEQLLATMRKHVLAELRPSRDLHE
jgi:hypothetical protein